MSEVISVGAIVVFMMLLLYMSLGAAIEKYHLPFGHEASFVILIGKFPSFQNSNFRHVDFLYRVGH